MFEYYNAGLKNYVVGEMLYSTVTERYQVIATFFGKHNDTWSCTITAGDGVTVTTSGRINYDATLMTTTTIATTLPKTAYTQSHTATVIFRVNDVEVVNSTDFARTTTADFAMNFGDPLQTFCNTDVLLLGYAPNRYSKYMMGGMQTGPNRGISLFAFVLGGSASGPYDIRGYIGPSGSQTVPFVHKRAGPSPSSTQSEYFLDAFVMGVSGMSCTINDVSRGKKFLLSTSAGTLPVEPDWPVLL